MSSLVGAAATSIAVAHAAEPASIEITLGWANVTAERMEQEVTAPLESRLKALPRVVQVRSITTNGTSKLKVIYPNEAKCSDVEAITAVLIGAQTALPSGASTPKITDGGAKC